MKDLYNDICQWLTNNPISTGGVLALILTGIRVAMAENKKSFGLVCLEGLCCGLLSMAFSYSAINMLHLDPSVGVLFGATAGFIGLDRLKALFIALIDSYLLHKYGKGGDNHD